MHDKPSQVQLNCSTVDNLTFACDSRVARAVHVLVTLPAGGMCNLLKHAISVTKQLEAETVYVVVKNATIASTL